MGFKLAFCCPFYKSTPPIVGDGIRANFINAAESGHVWVDDYSVSDTQHRNACEAMTYKVVRDDRIDASFWTEHDCLLPPHAVEHLCETLEKVPEADVAVGIAFRRCEPYNPMVSVLNGTIITSEVYEKMKTSPDPSARKAATLLSLEEVRAKTLVSIHEIDTTAGPFPVDAASLNCVLFRKGSLDKVKDVPDLWAIDSIGLFSIDNAFFLRLKEAGLKVYCDPRVLCGHLGDQEVIGVEKWMEHTQKVVEKYDEEKQLKLRELKGPEPRIYGELTRLANKNGTDKGTMDHRPDSGWSGWVHTYTPFYEANLDEIRLGAKKVLEIGVWHGASLKMWRDYFPNAEVYGVDIDPSLVEGELGERITVLKGDCGNRRSLGELIEKLGGDFDLIVDDGSHIMLDQQVSLGMLFPQVRRGGWYILEDLHTSFFPKPVVNETTGAEIEVTGDNPFGVAPDGSNATIHVIEALSRKQPVSSAYMTNWEQGYLQSNVERCLIYSHKKSLTSMLRKAMEEPKPGEIVTDGKNVKIGAPLVQATAPQPELSGPTGPEESRESEQGGE